jgi:hypothetical protein
LRKIKLDCSSTFLRVLTFSIKKGTRATVTVVAQNEKKDEIKRSKSI